MPIPALLAAVPSILQGAKGIFNVFKGGSDYKRAKNEMDKMVRPFYKIQEEYVKNKDIAASMAQQGLPQQTLDYFTTEAQRGLGSTLETMENLGGSPNDINAALDVYTRSIGRTAAEDAMKQTENINNFIKQQSELAAEKTKAWHFNEWQPYADKQALLAQQMGIAAARKEKGLEGILGSATNAITAIQNNDLLSSYSKFLKNKPSANNINAGLAGRAVGAIAGNNPLKGLFTNSTENINEDIDIPQPYNDNFID